MSTGDELRGIVETLEPARRAEIADALGQLLRNGRSGGDLLLAIAALDKAQVADALRIAQGLRRPTDELINPTSRVVTPRFAAEFRARLLSHHATHAKPIGRTEFENVFVAASRAARRRAKAAPSATTRFWDVSVRGKRISLKTEGAKAMKSDFIHISKLSEAAWIQDVRSGKDRHRHTVNLIDELLEAVDEMFILRVRAGAEPEYELVEIPVDHFARIRLLPRKAFDSDAPRIAVPADDGKTIMKLCLDRSDAKVTIADLAKSACIVHASWKLRAPTLT